MGCSPVVREPSTPVSAFLPPTALLHSGGAMPPSWLPPQHLSYRIAQSVQGPSPRFLSGPSLVCTHAVLRPRRLSNKRGCLELGRAIHCFRHFHIIRGVGVPHTSFPPRIHTTKCPPPHMHNLSRHPAQRACLKNLNGSFGPLPPGALWRPVETEHSPDSGGPIRPATRQSSCRA